MYLEEQKLLLCGIDHGFSTMKTAHFVFENGVKELGGEASLLTNTMFFNERYFKVGEGRLPLKDTKVEDGDYFLLTLAAIAREMDYHGLSDTEVCIAAGLPFTRFGQEKAEFKEYLNPGDREFQYNGKEYHIKCSDVFLYPQCYAAVADRLGKLPAELLEAMFKYGNASLASLVNHAMPLIPIRKTILTPYQRKCYARMYRLRLAEKKRFTYKSAYLYEQIRKMHELQEEYLLVVKYDVKSFVDLVHLKFRLQQVDEELCKVQKEMYRERASQKRSCKNAEELELFEASVDDYRERLEQIKLQKKDNLKKLKAVERCLERDGSMLDAELEYRIPVGNMDDLIEVARDEVPGNPHRQTEDLVVSQAISEDITDEIAADVGDRDTADINEISDNIVEIDTDEVGEPDSRKGDILKYGEAKLPSDKADYMRMSVAEKVRCYPFDEKGTDSAFEMVTTYFETVGLYTDFHTVYEAARLLTDYYKKQTAEEFIQKRTEQIIEIMGLLGINAEKIAEYPASVLAEVFGIGDMEYLVGIKMFTRVIDRLGVDMTHQERYEAFDRIYGEGMREKNYEHNSNIRRS